MLRFEHRRPAILLGEPSRRSHARQAPGTRPRAAAAPLRSLPRLSAGRARIGARSRAASSGAARSSRRSTMTSDLSTRRDSSSRSSNSSGRRSLDARQQVERPAAREHGEQAEEPLLVRRELVVAPLDGRLKRLMTRHRGPRSAGQQAEAIVEPLADLIDREHLDPRGRELDRQRNAIEPPADLGDSCALAAVSSKSATTLCARSTNSLTDSKSGSPPARRTPATSESTSDLSGSSRSPSMPRPSRLVTTSRRSAPAARRLSATRHTSPSRCSQLSRMMRIRFDRDVLADRLQQLLFRPPREPAAPRQSFRRRGCRRRSERGPPTRRRPERTAASVPPASARVASCRSRRSRSA